MVYYNNPDFAKDAFIIGKEYKLKVNKAKTRRERINLALRFYDLFIDKADQYGIKLECHQAPEPHYAGYVNHLVRKYRYKSVLDYGCAEGKFLNQLYTLNRNVKYFGIDFDIYNKKPRGFTYLKYKTENFIPEGLTFDLVTSHHVVEHIHPQDLTAHLNDIYDHLSPGGAYFLSLPSKNCSKFWDTKVIDNFHIGQYSYRDFKKIFQQTKFNNTKKILLNIKYLPYDVNMLVDLDFLNFVDKFNNKYLYAAFNLLTLRIIAFKE